MRVIAGAWRGRPLIAPPGQSTRPTADRVRESLFSMLVSRIGNFEEVTVADLYAGSGALGIEALSRGAAKCCFVERDRCAATALRANLAAVGATDRGQVINSTVESFMPSQPLQLILADPPYALGSGSAVVRLAAAGLWLAAGGWLAVETARGDAIDPGNYALEAERDIGRGRVTLLRNG